MVDNSRLTARRVRLLESELLMLQNYSNECQTLLEQYEQEYSSDISYFITHFSEFQQQVDKSKDTTNSPDANFSEIAEDDPRIRHINEDEECHKSSQDNQEKAASKKHPDWAKSLYRKIAMVTHPDKIREDERKERLEKNFQAASKALEENDYNKLITLALSLDLKTELGNSELIPLYKNQISEVKERISAIEKSIPWIWGEGFGMPNVKSAILLKILQTHKLKPDIDNISEAIELREKGQVS